jgi:V/A-type H+-transporting ATPase subunit I
MIAPMLKYKILAFHADQEHLIAMLKRLGLVHIKKMKHDPEGQMMHLKSAQLHLKQERKRFERLVPKEPIKGSSGIDDFSLEELDHYLDELKQLHKSIPRLEEEEFHHRHFGAYDPKKIETLGHHGLHLHLFSTGIGKIKDEWRSAYALEPLFDTGRKSFFLIASDDSNPPSIKAQSEPFPTRPLIETSQQLKTMRQRQDDLRQSLFLHKKEIRNFLQEHDLETLDQMQDVNATDQLVRMGFGKVIMLQGWIPKRKAEVLEAALDATDYYYERNLAEPSDAPPIKLENKSLGRWFEPITNLFALPDYHELDLTPFFAPFFLLFFGFCLGDGGYGLLLFIVLLALRQKVPAEYKGLWRLALALEAVAFPVGILAGTFFGINLFETEVPLLSSLRPFMLDADALFQAALVIGALQIFFGLVLKIINQWRQFGVSYAFSPFGWILLLSGLGWGYLTDFGWIQTTLSWSGLGLIVIFSDPKAGILTRLGKGLWDLYGITGFFGDLLSYIRLFALGLAGSILGFVVNDIALSILGSHKILGPIFFVVMLIVGHGLNIFIATLGAFVHPMRLTFVEFYKNAGFKGGGETYQPLQNLKTEDKS